MKEKLSHEVLLRALDDMFNGQPLPEYATIEKQAYEQIKKLINDQWGAEQYYLDTIKELQKQLKSAKT